MRRRPFALSLSLIDGQEAMIDNVYRYDALDTVRLDARTFPPDYVAYDTDHDTGSLSGFAKRNIHAFGY